MVREKFIDFKLLQLFKIAFFILAVLSLLFPWTVAFHDTGYDSPGPPPTYCTGLDYLQECDPIGFLNEPHPTQKLYLLFFPLILLISLILSFFENKKYVISSIFISFFSFVPIVVWLYDMSDILRTHWVNLTWGVIIALISIIAFIVLGFLTLAFCDLDTGENREQKAGAGEN